MTFKWSSIKMKIENFNLFNIKASTAGQVVFRINLQYIQGVAIAMSKVAQIFLPYVALIKNFDVSKAV